MLLPSFQTDSHVSDPIASELAPLVRKLTYVLLLACVVLLPVYLAVALLGVPIGWMLIVSVCLLIPSLLLTLLLLRSRFQTGVVLLAVGIILAVTFVLVMTGLEGSPLFLGLLAPIIFVAPLISRGGRLAVIVTSLVITVTVAVLKRPTPLFSDALSNYDLEVIISVSIMILMAFFSDQTSTLLRAALVTSITRSQDLANLNAQLETQVADRTANLHEALALAEQRESRLAVALEEVQRSQATIQQLSAPIIPVSAGVLIAPLIGLFDSARIGVFVENVLAAVEHHHARYVAFDLTGAVMTAAVAHELARVADAVQLLGAGVWIVGIRPEIAEMVVANGIDMSRFALYPDMETALRQQIH